MAACPHDPAGLAAAHNLKGQVAYFGVPDLHAQLDELERNARTHAEKTFDVDLTRKPVLNFSVGPTLTVHVGQAVAFDALDSVLPDCQSVVVVWDFRDGFIQQGRRVEHSFRKAGRFPVRMSLRGYGPGAGAASNCVSQEVIVEP